MAKRPWTLGLLNAVVGALGRVGIASSLDPEALVAAARKRTGLSDFGGDDWREPLELLVGSATTEAALTPLGRYYLREDLIQRLSNRLLVEDACRRDPQILAEPIERPVFILGLPRSGTTHLHRLLAQDPQSRVLTTWEMAEPAPPPRPETYDTDPRIARLERKLSFINWAGPELRAIHDVDARQPEECISLMANDLCSVWFTIGVHVPAYVSWYHAQDLGRSYRGHRRQLQLLQRHMRLDRWVLKAPIHMHGLEWLLETYPDARIIWTHRDPAEVVPSAASLLHNFRSIFCAPRDPAEVGRDCLELLASWTERGARARAAYEARRPARGAVFHDVDYADIVSSPQGTIGRIYDAFEMPLGDEALGRMQAHLTNAVQNRFGVHRYSLEDFGLDSAKVGARFAGLA
ncbi:MAG: sulfotransferase [Deltaproteobacteria bacterium]|nr:sulfotransferase [Deltaproteobacteria bacterium]